MKKTGQVAHSANVYADKWQMKREATERWGGGEKKSVASSPRWSSGPPPCLAPSRFLPPTPVAMVVHRDAFKLLGGEEWSTDMTFSLPYPQQEYWCCLHGRVTCKHKHNRQSETPTKRQMFSSSIFAAVVHRIHLTCNQICSSHVTVKISITRLNYSYFLWRQSDWLQSESAQLSCPKMQG